MPIMNEPKSKPRLKVIEFKDHGKVAIQIRGLTVNDFENGAWSAKIEQIESDEAAFIIDCLEGDEFRVIEIVESDAPDPGRTWVRDVKRKRKSGHTLEILKIGPPPAGSGQE